MTASCGVRKVQTLDEVVNNSDLNQDRNEYHFRTPFVVDRLSHLLKDPRDLPMLCLLVNILEAVIPGVIGVFAVCLQRPEFSLLTRNLIGAGYVISLVVLFQERFTLCIHFAAHRNIFHSKPLNVAIDWAFAPFFGIPCGMYKLHHVIMHHIENNHELDMSSTERYQRDSWLHFFSYWFHFVILIWVEVPSYTIRTKKYDKLASCLSGVALWLTCLYLLSHVDALATFWVLVVPHMVAMTAMAFGNWAQHIFVNPEDRFSNYALTYNCIDTPVNKTTFNDGYHIVHHLNARLHWSEMPKYFYDNQAKHHEKGALTFRGVHFMDVGILVMTRQLTKLAECYVHLGSKDTAPTVDEVELKLRAWLRPVSEEHAKTKVQKVS